MIFFLRTFRRTTSTAAGLIEGWAGDRGEVAELGVAMAK